MHVVKLDQRRVYALDILVMRIYLVLVLDAHGVHHTFVSLAFYNNIFHGSKYHNSSHFRK